MNKKKKFYPIISIKREVCTISGNESSINIQPLLSISPKLHHYISSELLSQFHIHSYDFQTYANKTDEGINLIIRFGSQFSHEKEMFIRNDQLNTISSEFEEFVKETGKACKQVLIDDYFNKMAP
ncbi:hypothetical protein ACLIA0_12980 [Bacillaceae bacterium W0354]